MKLFCLVRGLMILAFMFLIKNNMNSQIEQKINWSILAGPEFNLLSIPNNYEREGVDVGFIGGFNGNYHVNEKTDFVSGLNFVYRKVSMKSLDTSNIKQVISSHIVEVPIGVRRYLFENKRYSSFFIGGALVNNFVIESSANQKISNDYITYYKDLDKSLSFYNPGLKLEFGLKSRSFKRKYVLFSGYIKNNFMNLFSTMKREKYNFLTLGVNIEYTFY